MKKLFLLFIIGLFIFTACSKDSDDNQGISTIAAESWQVIIDSGTGSGIWDMQMKSDSSLVFSGSFNYGSISSPIAESVFSLDDDNFAFSVNGTSNNPEAPQGYQNSEYELSVSGNLNQDAGYGTYTISYAQQSWNSPVSGSWTAEKTEGSGITSQETQAIFELVIPDDFDFKLEKNVELFIELKTNSDEPVPNIIYDISYVNSQQNYNYITSMRTDESGIINTNLIVPSYVEKLYISGFMNSIELELINDYAEYKFGGVFERGNEKFSLPKMSRDFSFLPGITYNSQGVPSPVGNYPISPELLERIDTSLPESYDLAITHPQYLEQGVTTNLIVEDSSDVWINFVTEGAGYKNALGFYTYDTEEGPPDDPEELDHILIFPNSSLLGEGGGLTPGMQIYLGRFGAGTTIGWFLVQNGWISGSNVNQYAQIFYSDPQYNPEVEEYQQHSVLLYDAQSELFLLAFDDQLRPDSADNDFNDAVFFATANPIENINTDNIPPIDIPIDSDEDGVNDPFDEYPDDPDRAFDVYYPSQDNFSSVVFEDLWPSYGDYDMNDMVIDYQYHLITNADNEIVNLDFYFSLRGAGAGYNNGFAIVLPFEENSLSITDFSEDLSPAISADGDYSIFDIFSNTTSITGLSPGVHFNTNTDAPYYEPQNYSCSLELSPPAAIDELDFYFPFNPFLRKQGSIDVEVHLMDYSPSGRVNMELFATEDDNSNPAQNSWYVSPLNLPWALNMPESWLYPSEKNAILEAYLHFAAWAESGGMLYEDWYIINDDNADMTKIYSAP